MDRMQRREFLEAIAGVSALIPGLTPLAALGEVAQAVHARAKSPGKLRTLTPLQDATVTRIGDILLPETDTIGASGVGVNRFIDLLLSESMPDAQRDRFLAGLAAINARSQSLHGGELPAIGRKQQESLVRELDARLPTHALTPAETAALAKAPITAEAGFAALKSLVLFAYFTSEPVAKGLINAPIIPGRYDGCIPL
jgi:glucoside 3-dehydrogenase (cytochrome c) hitch-hiker subunit